MDESRTGRFPIKDLSQVSVVIPTLGGDSLAGTIEKLNRGTHVPKEILICIPEEYGFRVEALCFGNVKVIKTACRGQVAQRAIGFQKAEGPWVLQLDDDVSLDRTCMEELMKCISAIRHASVGPTLLDSKTNQSSRYMKEPKKGEIFGNLLVKIANGAEGFQPGGISKSGVNMGFSDTSADPYEVEWLPGGCVLHSKENLVLYDFYPFPGKAYGEDLYHSNILRNNRISLYHCPMAVCRVNLTSSQAAGVFHFAKIMFGFSRAMLHFAKATNRSRLRFCLFLPVYVISLIKHKIRAAR